MNSVIMKKRLLCVALAGFLSAGFGTALRTLGAPQVSRTPQVKTTAVSPEKEPGLPAALEAIAWMAEANVGPGILLAFVGTSPVAYNPRPRDIIALKKRGVPDEVIIALVEHGAKIRANLEKSARARLKARERRSHRSPYRPPASNVQPPAPTPVYVPYPVPAFAPYGQVTSFNSTYPTYINGQAVYSGYYIPGYGYLY